MLVARSTVTVRSGAAAAGIPAAGLPGAGLPPAAVPSDCVPSADVPAPGATAPGAAATGPVVIFDDDHYYLGAVLAEKLRLGGLDVALVTPSDRVSAWTANTLEQHAIQKRLLELGIEVCTNRNVVEFDGSALLLECTYTGRRSSLPGTAVITVTSRLPNDELLQALDASSAAIAAAGIVSITSIGDCCAPSTIAAAVYAGHRYAREFDRPRSDEVPFRRELTDIRPPAGN